MPKFMFAKSLRLIKIDKVGIKLQDKHDTKIYYSALCVE